MMILLGLKLLVLARMTWEDWASRTLYIFWFPVLAILFFAGNPVFIPSFLFLNLSVLVLQGGCILLILRLPKRRISEWRSALGSGDVLMLVLLAWILPTAVFLVFQVITGLTLLMINAFAQVKSGKSLSSLPLAGHQACCLGVGLLLLHTSPFLNNYYHTLFSWE